MCTASKLLFSWSEIKLQCPLLARLLCLRFFVSVAYGSSGNASAFWKQKLSGYLHTPLISLWFCDIIYLGSENEMHCCVSFHGVFPKGVRWGMSDKRKQILLQKQTLFLPFSCLFFLVIFWFWKINRLELESNSTFVCTIKRCRSNWRAAAGRFLKGRMKFEKERGKVELLGNYNKYLRATKKHKPKQQQQKKYKKNNGWFYYSK